jgi:hypothetical protein
VAASSSDTPRVVIQGHTAPILRDLAVFITRNLPFIDQVALMVLDMTGLAARTHWKSGSTRPTTS